MKLQDSLVQFILKAIEKKAVEEELTEEQVQQYIHDFTQKMMGELDTFSTDVSNSLKQGMPGMLVEHRELQAEFEQRLYERWKKALDLYDTCVVIGRECGEEFVKERRAQAAKENDLVFEVLMRIHARACQTVSEISHLLKGGYAKGALARQRTFHELAVTAAFIEKHKQETAQRYIEHEIIEVCKIVREHELACEQLGETPYDPAYIAQLHLQKAELVRKYGKVFKGDYGWAAYALDEEGKKKSILYKGRENVSFRDIEENVGYQYLRPYYKMASHGVHANIKGLLFDIGNRYKEKPEYNTILLAGASNAGLADPGQLALLSFHQCTRLLLSLKPDIDGALKIQVLKSFVDEACNAFIEAHHALLREGEEKKP